MNGMRCKYDPDHGTFATPVQLRRHYDTEHAGQYQPNEWNGRTWRCRMCGRTMKNPNSHVHQVHHHEMPDQPWTMTYFDMLDEDGNVIREGTWSGTWTKNGGPSTALDRVAHHLHGRPPEPEHHPWHTDDIVIPVITDLAQPSGMVPVVHLAAILAWRDATAVMLATVAQQSKPT